MFFVISCLFSHKHLHSTASQVATSYTSRSGRSLLRLYHLFPNRVRLEIVEILTVRSLMALPEPDFVQMLSLLPEDCRTSSLPILEELEMLLQKAFFPEFWLRVQGEKIVELLGKTGLGGVFQVAVRGFIAGVLCRTYRHISLGELGACLGLSETEARKWVGGKGWTIDGSGLVEVPPVTENSPRAPLLKAGEDGIGLKFSEVMSVLQVKGDRLTS